MQFRLSIWGTILWTALGFLSGSLMFSYWLGRLVGKDVRTVGDGNPGAANAIKAAGPLIGVTGGVLDFLKGAIPVGAAVGPPWTHGTTSWNWHLVPIAVAPVLGHLFSPWLAGHGGKGIAVTFGVWAGLTGWEVPSVLGGACACGKFLLRLPDAWAVICGFTVSVLFICIRAGFGALLCAAIVNLGLLIFTHRRELRLGRQRGTHH
ncbi:MAG: glycerol-3-phosphate acyltransferase [candidate division KSB1 bacterium]|nr:glycerol-3-phosphate acyltransferase [candidate division KSB1 bacterium]MDZ7393671.1 glycerol-3-phosphate acyltransferase [candidate division KSB1 bacterium]